MMHSRDPYWSIDVGNANIYKVFVCSELLRKLYSSPSSRLTMNVTQIALSINVLIL